MQIKHQDVCRGKHTAGRDPCHIYFLMNMGTWKRSPQGLHWPGMQRECAKGWADLTQLHFPSAPQTRFALEAQGYQEEYLGFTRKEMTSRTMTGAGAKWMGRMEFGSAVEASADTHTVGFSPSAAWERGLWLSDGLLHSQHLRQCLTAWGRERRNDHIAKERQHICMSEFLYSNKFHFELRDQIVYTLFINKMFE